VGFVGKRGSGVGKTLVASVEDIKSKLEEFCKRLGGEVGTRGPFGGPTACFVRVDSVDSIRDHVDEFYRFIQEKVSPSDYSFYLIFVAPRRDELEEYAELGYFPWDGQLIVRARVYGEPLPPEGYAARDWQVNVRRRLGGRTYLYGSAQAGRNPFTGEHINAVTVWAESPLGSASELKGLVEKVLREARDLAERTRGALITPG